MGEFWNYLTVTYNVWFTAPLATVFLFAIFRLVLSGLDFGDADVDANVDADVDFDVDVDIDVDADTSVVADSGTSSNSFADVLGFLNVGRVPFMIVVMTLFTMWGSTGLMANELLKVKNIPSMFWISCMIALVCGVLGTRYLSLTLSKVFPESDPATKDLHLLGLQGRVISGQITETFGTARVQVPDGHTSTVRCRVEQDESNPVKGDTVILVNYDSDKRIFDVQPIEKELY